MLITIPPIAVLCFFFSILFISAVNFFGNFMVIILLKSIIKNNVSTCLFIYFYVTIFTSILTFYYAAIMVAYWNYRKFFKIVLEVSILY